MRPLEADAGGWALHSIQLHSYVIIWPKKHSNVLFAKGSLFFLIPLELAIGNFASKEEKILALKAERFILINPLPERV
jgi:hypothetical protein